MSVVLFEVVLQILSLYCGCKGSRCGGTVGAMVTCPLEVIKTRLQSSGLTLRQVYLSQVQLGTLSGTSMVRPTRVAPGLFQILRSILEKEGPRSLFRGLGPNLVGVAPSRAIYFAAYSKSKEKFNAIFVPNSNMVHMCSAGFAAFVTNSLMNPIWMVKTRMQLERRVRGVKQMNALQCAKYVYQSEGIRGFYRGLTASYAGISETIICFVIYESLKKNLGDLRLSSPTRKSNEKGASDFLGLMIAAAFSKGCASCIAYPHEVIRTRLREEGSKYKYFFQTARLVAIEEGYPAFYRGLIAQLIRQIPNTAIVLSTDTNKTVYVYNTPRCIIISSMEGLNQVLSEYPQLGIAGGVGATICAAGALIYKIATRKKPSHIEVNCWFCDQDTVVPYGNRNCWDCPNCDQYNGFQENGHYNKPIPAQHLEHLNHGVSAGLAVPETPKVLQWVNCQMLLCKKCNNNQTLKIKQLASFVPREEEKYDEEIEVYKHHLEQTYKLCRPCQTAVEYYIKHQNRQLRAVLFNHQLRRSREADKAYVQNSYTPNFSTPARVIFLRILAFLSCVFLVVLAVYGSEDPFTPASSLHSPPAQPVLNHSNASGSLDGNAGGGQGAPVWQELFSLVPQEAVENLKVAWDYGKSHQMAVVSLGLFTCLMAVFLAGRVRLRRIDAVASVLWLTVLGLHLVENYLKTDLPSWLEAAKFSTTSLCCLVGFTAAVATRKSSGQRRYRARRYLSGDSATSFYSGDPGILSPALSASSVFLPTPPPILSHLVNHQLCHRVRKASPSSLPGRLNRALSLGTIPSITRAGKSHFLQDSGYLFSGSRPSSQISNCKDSTPSDAKSILEGGSVFDELDEKRGSSSGSSTCLVDTTTGDCPDSGKGLKGNSILQGLLCLSLTVNIIYTSVYLYQSLR
ncbi:UNVERIFIED_CONTAM: hypothetical protein FKN15_035702 [Acipenser sinensis]